MRIVFAIAIVLVLAACHDPDDVYLKVCWSGDMATYPSGNNISAVGCPMPEDISWPTTSVPLKVFWEDADYSGSFSEAVNFWDREVGNLFDHSTDLASADVLVMLGAVDGHLGITEHRHLSGGGRLYANVTIEPGDITEVAYVTKHELGHVLGLAHDPGDPDSVMHPTFETGVDFSQGFPFVYVTDNDTAALKARYLSAGP